MAVKVAAGLPAVSCLLKEGADILARRGDGPENPVKLKVGILNLMPIKEDAERDLLRLLYDNPYIVEVTFVELSTYRGSHTSADHLDNYYVKWPNIRNQKFDGFIITGAPVEELDYESVAYWEELKEIMDWCRTNVRSTVFICWGALAAMYHFYGVRKRLFSRKLSGVYVHRSKIEVGLTEKLGEEYFIPHSRFATPDAEDLADVEELKVFCESRDAGIYGLMTARGEEIYLTGHIEYSPFTLHEEYIRDLNKGINPRIPENYYKNDIPGNELKVNWLPVAKRLFSNWLKYYVEGPDGKRKND